jgi:uncharacterized protein with NRDE domain
VCTIGVAFRVRPDRPVILAANRDEFYARPARGPGPLGTGPGGVRIAGGRDETAGGTWLALRADGAFAAVTNQRSFGARDPSRRSRGELPLALLARPVAEMAELARALEPGAYNDGNLMFGDARGVWVAYLRADLPTEVVALPPGVHVLTNDRLGSPDFPRAERTAALLAPAVERPWDEAVRFIQRTLADHARPPDDRVGEPPPCSPFGKDFLASLQQICIHTPAYGTRSSSIAALGDDRVLAYHHAEGHPCETRFVDAMEALA